MKEENMRSEGAVLRSSVKKHRRLLSVAAVLLICCLVFVGVASATETEPPSPPKVSAEIVTESNNDYNVEVKFTSIDITEEQLSYYKDWIVDLVLTLDMPLQVSSDSSTDTNYIGVKFNDDNWNNYPSTSMMINEKCDVSISDLVSLESPILVCDVYSVESTEFVFGLHLSEEFVTQNLIYYDDSNVAHLVENSQFGGNIAFVITPPPDDSDSGTTESDSITICNVEITAEPTATVTEIVNDDLTFALNFKANAVPKEILEYYSRWYADFMLTTNKEIILLAEECGNPDANGYLSGQYDEYAELWVNVPFGKGVTLNPDNDFGIIQYAVEKFPGMFGGSYVPYGMVYAFKEGFDCGIHLHNDFIYSEDNHDLFITLELRMIEPGDNGAYGQYTTICKYDFKTYPNLTFYEDEVGGKMFLFSGGTSNPFTITYGMTPEEISIPVPTRVGYTFEKWISDDEEISFIRSQDSIGEIIDIINRIPVKDVNFTASWTPNTYTIIFNENGGDGEMSPQEFTYDDGEILNKNSFTREGYTFAGWMDSVDGEVEYDDEECVINLATDGNVPLYANWTANTYTVIFHANGGEGTMAEQVFTYDEEQELTALNFTKAGHTFKSWNTAADGLGTSYQDKKSVKNLTPDADAEITLYAQWEKIQETPAPTPENNKPNRAPTTTTVTKSAYQVVFYPNGGIGEMDAATFVEGEEKAIPANTFTRDGYTFKGWSLTSGGEVFYTDGELVLIDETTYLYAVWEEVAPETPSDEPTEPETPETPAPLFAVLAGLGVAVVLRRK